MKMKPLLFEITISHPLGATKCFTVDTTLSKAINFLIQGFRVANDWETDDDVRVTEAKELTTDQTYVFLQAQNDDTQFPDLNEDT